EVVDAAGNRIRVRWDDERVVAVTDSVGRELHVERDGKVDIWRLTLTSLEGEKHTSFVASYEYDDRGDLVRVIDAGGAVTSYRYDDQHYLVEERLPDGLSYHFVYEKGADGKRRCVETWGAIDGLDVLADLSGGYLTTSPERKGVHHTRFVYEPERRRTTMIDAMGHSHRFVGNDLGLVTEYVDPLGGVTRRAFTPTGGMVMEVDPTGRRERRSIDAAGRWLRYGNAKGSVAFKRDAAGHASEVLESDGSRWQMERNAQGKIVKRTHPDGSAVTCAYDERGLALEVSGPGGKETYEYDAHGNLVRRTNVCGATWRYSWDLRGYPVEAVTPSGGSYRFEYDSWGNVADVKTSDGRRSQRELDALGKAVAVQYPGGGVGHTRWVAGSIVERSYADDHGAWRFGYDAMLRLIWLENPDGERQAFSYDGAGRLASHRQLTGHEWHYDRDAAGNVVARTGAEGTAHYELDEVGKIVAQSHVDGSRTVVLRDHFGRPVEGRHGITEVTLEREPSRFVRREVQQAGAWRFVVERSYDELGYEIATRYSTGWGVERERGQGGNVHAIRVVDGDGGVEEGFELGWEGERVIRRQGSASAIRTLRDEWRRAVAVQVVGKDGEVLRERHYRWSVLGAVEEVVDSRRGSRRYTLDNMSRPTAVDGLGSRETFRYTCHGTPVATSRDEKVGSFGRKTQVAGTTYAWDGQGRLFRQIGASPHESWEYSYDGQSQLVAATRGDGYWVKHIYDAFGRRLATNRSDGTSTFYGWDRDTIVEETHSDGRRERRVYGIDGMTAYASARDEGPWRLIASDQAGTPWLYLDPEDGIEELDLTAWGRVAHREGKPGSLRFAGQIQDDDTGLYYNRYRYYSPELGTYLTPDPLGLQASARHDIGFVPNTTAWVDLLGLIIISAAPNDPEGEVQEAVKHRAGATNEDVLNVSSGGGLVPANGGAASDKPLAGHKRVEIISHGPPSGSCILWGDERIDGTELGKRLQEAGLEPDAEVVIVACFAGADSSSSGKKRTVAAKLNKATGNPVFGPSGITNVLPWPNTSEEINGHLNMNGGHWTSATGPAGGPQTLTSNAPPTQKTDTF
ncbi:MAG: RHS repeat protein, partial [Myxococcales bacterium]|nr:RHS repeat protein [Myxococcales bacterium]